MSDEIILIGDGPDMGDEPTDNPTIEPEPTDEPAPTDEPTDDNSNDDGDTTTEQPTEPTTTTPPDITDTLPTTGIGWLATALIIAGVLILIGSIALRVKRR